MSETVSLHIQASDSGPIRVVELSGSTARIGRSPSCEVQIADPALAAGAMRPPPPRERVAPRPGRAPGCGLDRRTRGRAGPAALARRPVPGGRPLVDPASLGCRRRRMGVVPDPDPGGDAPVARPGLGRPPGRGRGGEGTEDLRRTRGIASRGVGPRVGGGTPVALGGPPRAARTLAGGAQEEKRWEERWRAAGESLRARSGTQTSRLVTSPRPSPPGRGCPKGG